MSGHDPTQSTWGDTIEETLIAAILGAMTLITFANVVARAMETNILWALEVTVFLFAWLVLLGASYAVKKSAHLGVDLIVNMLSPSGRKALGLVSGVLCLIFGLLLLKGAYDYWAVFADLPPTSGRVFPTGWNLDARSQSFYEVQDVPMLGIFRFLEDLINYGDSYEKLPKVVPYIVLPLSMLLFVIRVIQAMYKIATGTSDRMVASHEVEDEIDEMRAARGENV